MTDNITSAAPAAPEKKKIVLSGIQPSGLFTIGNYLGAVKTWSEIQEQYNCVFMVANLHATTVRQDPAALKKNTVEGYAMLLAAGVDPERSIVFIQSHNPNHAQLMWALNCYTQFGELSRMTQFKDKSAKYSDNINAGLFTYPTLMAADILLYQADLVPVGADQKQHVELARDITNRMNGVYGNLFTMPECLFPKAGAKIMSLTDPTKKMSKSDPNPKSYVAILDPKDTVIKKFKSAVTDSGSGIYRAEGKEGIGNLMTIYSAFTGKNDEEIMREFDGMGYGQFKVAVGETVADALAPTRERFEQLMADKAYLKSCWEKGAEDAFRFSKRTLDKVYKKMGFLP
ncbi:MAG: tryptophan--tRNA ligase [Oscillospiraceae bacterium]|nr:tryptophan--tRNA ligase [Oscillospiraceae bacterium]